MSVGAAPLGTLVKLREKNGMEAPQPLSWIAVALIAAAALGFVVYLVKLKADPGEASDASSEPPARSDFGTRKKAGLSNRYLKTIARLDADSKQRRNNALEKNKYID
jgi:hypothetical protein